MEGGGKGSGDGVRDGIEEGKGKEEEGEGEEKEGDEDNWEYESSDGDSVCTTPRRVWYPRKDEAVGEAVPSS